MGTNWYQISQIGTRGTKLDWNWHRLTQVDTEFDGRKWGSMYTDEFLVAQRRLTQVCTSHWHRLTQIGTFLHNRLTQISAGTRWHSTLSQIVTNLHRLPQSGSHVNNVTGSRKPSSFVPCCPHCASFRVSLQKRFHEQSFTNLIKWNPVRRSLQRMSEKVFLKL